MFVTIRVKVVGLSPAHAGFGQRVMVIGIKLQTNDFQPDKPPNLSTYHSGDSGSNR